MSVAAFVPLHYGKDYLRQAIAAMAPVVDKIVVLYTNQPSYGHAGNLECPETEDELHACCDGFKVDWHRGNFGSETQHRQAGYELCRDMDLCVQCDADEVWDTPALADCIRRATDSPAGIFPVRGFVHFWRSFNWCCRDVWTPTRLLRPRVGSDGGTQQLDGTIYHFGYAIPDALVAYKWSCHGHKDELRGDWLDGIFRRWPDRKTDLHPCVFNWWNAEAFDRTTLPDGLKSHPFYGLDVIA